MIKVHDYLHISVPITEASNNDEPYSGCKDMQ